VLATPIQALSSSIGYMMSKQGHLTNYRDSSVRTVFRIDRMRKVTENAENLSLCTLDRPHKSWAENELDI
jgi:hypothetical protein